jgi:integrase
MPKLSVARVRSARHPGDKHKHRPIRLSDSRGLNLQITPGGSKSWLFRFMRHGKAREMGLGTCDPDGRHGVCLAEARRLAGDAQRQLQAGLDPIAERKKATIERRQMEERSKAHTFRLAAEGCIEAQRPGWRNDKHAAQWASTLETHVYPTLGGMDVADITINDVVGILNPIWKKIPETASRVRQRIEKILDYAAAPSRRWRSPENPARWRGVLEHELSPIAKVKKVQHYPSLPWHRMKDFMAALYAHEGVAAKALKFAILTASRSGEVRQAKWREVDLDAGVWTIPGEKMKARRLHRVALSKPAISLLREMLPLSSGKPNALVFPSRSSEAAMSDMALSQLLRGMSFDGLEKGERPRWRDAEGRAVVVHGFRSTFKAWTLSTSYPDHLSEIALAHTDKNKVRAAYAREDLLEERKPMMEAWGKFCTEPSATVADIGDARRRRRK